ncbi:MAG: OadG family protein [Bacilli bacterium]|nr:OadG family protein [Bacilli bacterium]MDD4077326.1 OadG family protein [Bacilli bacterium]MDD4389038.1 OadG family protein [Bacilli bacterium]
MFLAIYDGKEFNSGNFPEALLITLFSMSLVFLILLFLMFTISIFKYFKFTKEKSPTISEASSKSVNWADMDEDMQVAALVATIDYNAETKQDTKLVSIKRIDQE